MTPVLQTRDPRRRAIPTVLAVLLTGLVVIPLGCSGGSANQAGQVPITTSSDKALRSYLRGRDLLEKLRRSEAREHFLAAIDEDSSFAMAYLRLTQCGSTAAERFGGLRRALALVDRISDGERLLIRALEAQVNGEPQRRRQYLLELVDAYPDDARARFQLATFYFGRQDYHTAIEHYRMATLLDPEYSPTYNLLGYSLRFIEDYVGAEEAFKRYIDLIPDEPNPYDSYAELLMKMGRFEESIAMYEKALQVNLNFAPSYVGIGLNHVFLGQPVQARNAFTTLSFIARNDDEKRQAHTWSAMSYLHDAEYDAALGEVQKRYILAREANDLVNMAADLDLLGDILLAAGRVDEALARYRDSIEAIERSNATADVKEAARRNDLFDLARAALARDELELAEAYAEQYKQQVELRQIPAEVWLCHELLGLVALEAGDLERSVAELDQSNQQDPRALFLRARAYQALGRTDTARAICARAANFNGLAFNYAYVRVKALRLLEQLMASD